MGKRTTQRSTAQRPVRAMAGTISLLLLASCAVAQTRTAQTLSVAILAPECQVMLSESERAAALSRVDTSLLHEFSSTPGVTLVDRQSLDKLLSEKTLEGLGGAEAIAPAWRAADVLICAALIPAAKDSGGEMSLIIESVSAQTGQLMGRVQGMYIRNGEGWSLASPMEQALAELKQRTLEQYRQSRVLPLVEVADVKPKGIVEYAQWRADELADAIRAAVATSRGFVLLVPRHPLVTREERLLTLAGLTRAAGKTLSPVPQWRLTVELEERVKENVPSDQTAVQLKVKLFQGQRVAAEKEFSGTIGQFDALHQDVLNWCIQRLREGTGTPSVVSADPDADAARQALDELSAARELDALRCESLSPFEVDRRQRVLAHAMRATHLDPTLEEAAFLTVRYAAAPYEAKGQYDSLVCKDRILAECSRYEQRFGKRVSLNYYEVVDRAFREGWAAAYSITGGKRDGKMLTPPSERLYAYYGPSVRALSEIGYLETADKTCPKRSNSDEVFTYWLRYFLIPNIPERCLDDEYHYWHTFWREKAVRMSAKVAPWEIVEAAFQARRKNPAAVRTALEKLGAVYPKDNRLIWDDPQILNTVRDYLKAAGDKDWETWEPQYAIAATQPIRPINWHKYVLSHLPFVLRPWDVTDLASLPSQRLMLPVESPTPGEVQLPPVTQPLLCVGDELWFTTPRQWDLENLRRPHCIASVPLAAILVNDGKQPLRLTEIFWPADTPPRDSTRAGGPLITSWHIVPNQRIPTVWIGTNLYGAVRFQKVEGKWVGRWYGSRQGMPSSSITSIGSYATPAGRRLLLQGQGKRLVLNAQGKQTWENEIRIWSLDPEKDTCIVHATRPWLASPALTLTLPDQRKRLLWLYDQSDYEGLDPAAAQEIGQLPVMYVPLITHHPGQTPSQRLWYLAGYARHGWSAFFSADLASHGLVEASADTLTKRADTLGRGMGAHAGFNRLHMAGHPWPHLAYYLPPQSPIENVISAMGIGDSIWMTAQYSPGTSSDQADRILIYRPAAFGDAEWRKHDQWIGPFPSPDGSPIFGMMADQRGHLFVTTSNGVHRIDVSAALDQARKTNHVQSTEAWQQSYDKRLAAADWQTRVQVLLAQDKSDAAIEIIQALLDKLGQVNIQSPQATQDQYVQLVLYKAMALSLMPDKKQEVAGLYRLLDEGHFSKPRSYGGWPGPGGDRWDRGHETE